MEFLGDIIIDRSDVNAKGQGQRVKVKVTDVMAPLSRFRTVTPVWIHIRWWNDAQSLMLLRRCALLFFKVIPQFFQVTRKKNRRFWPKLGVSGLELQFEFTNDYEMMHKAWSSIWEFPIDFQGHPSNFKVTLVKKIADFDPNWAFRDCNSSLNSSMALKWCTELNVV